MHDLHNMNDMLRESEQAKRLHEEGKRADQAAFEKAEAIAREQAQARQHIESSASSPSHTPAPKPAPLSVEELAALQKEKEERAARDRLAAEKADQRNHQTCIDAMESIRHNLDLIARHIVLKNTPEIIEKLGYDPSTRIGKFRINRMHNPRDWLDLEPATTYMPVHDDKRLSMPDWAKIILKESIERERKRKQHIEENEPVIWEENQKVIAQNTRFFINSLIHNGVDKTIQIIKDAGFEVSDKTNFLRKNIIESNAQSLWHEIIAAEQPNPERISKPLVELIKRMPAFFAITTYESISKEEQENLALSLATDAIEQADGSIAHARQQLKMSQTATETYFRQKNEDSSSKGKKQQTQPPPVLDKKEVSCFRVAWQNVYGAPPANLPELRVKTPSKDNAALISAYESLILYDKQQNGPVTLRTLDGLARYKGFLEKNAHANEDPASFSL